MRLGSGNPLLKTESGDYLSHRRARNRSEKKRKLKLGSFLRKHHTIYCFNQRKDLPLPKLSDEVWNSKQVKVSRIKGRFVSWKLC